MMCRRTIFNWSARRGFFALEALLGIVLIVAMTAAVLAILSGQRRAAIATAEQRSASRLAEDALAQLQSNGKAPDGVAIHTLPDSAPAGWQWVEASSMVGSHRCVLRGIVPTNGGQR